MKTYTICLDTSPPAWVQKQLCNHSLAFYSLIQVSVSMMALRVLRLALSDNGRLK